MHNGLHIYMCKMNHYMLRIRTSLFSLCIVLVSIWSISFIDTKFLNSSKNELSHEKLSVEYKHSQAHILLIVVAVRTNKHVYKWHGLNPKSFSRLKRTNMSATMINVFLMKPLREELWLQWLEWQSHIWMIIQNIIQFIHIHLDLRSSSNIYEF